MKIIINENQLNQLIEAYGQVSNMEISVQRIIIELNRQVKKHLVNLDFTQETGNTFNFDLNFPNALDLQTSPNQRYMGGPSSKSGDRSSTKINKIKITLEIIFDSDFKGDPQLRNLAVGFLVEPVLANTPKDKKNPLKIRNVFATGKEPNMFITILSNKENSANFIYRKIFLDGEELLQQSISHEIMHFIDLNRQPYVNVYDMVHYRAVTEIQQNKTGIPPLDQLWDIMYYLSKIETTVRPTEIMSLLNFKGAKKEDFKRVLENSKIYRNIVYAKKFDAEKFRDNLETFGKNVYGTNPKAYQEYKNKIKDKFDEFVKKYEQLLKDYGYRKRAIPIDTYDPTQVGGRTLSDKSKNKFRYQKRGDKDTWMVRKKSGKPIYDEKSMDRYLTNYLQYLGNRAIKKIGRVYAALD